MTLKIEVGKKYKTRLDSVVNIFAFDSGVYVGRLLVCHNSNRIGQISQFKSDGLCTSFQDCSELVSEYKEPVFKWFNMYDTCEGIMYYSSLSEAKKGHMGRSDYSSAKKIAIIRINMNTGEVTNEPI